MITNGFFKTIFFCQKNNFRVKKGGFLPFLFLASYTTSTMSTTPPAEKNISITPFRFLAVFAIAFVVLVLLNFICVFYLKNYNPNKAYALIRHKWEMLLNKKNAATWLILGDSSGNQGVDAQLFEKDLGEKAINLCTIADMLVVNDVWMLEKYIQVHGPPKKLLIIHTYDIWKRQIFPTGFMAQIPIDLQSDAALSMRYLALPNWKKHLMNYAPLNYQRESLSWLIQHPQQLFQSSFHYDKYGFEAKKTADVENVLEDTAEHLKFVRESQFQISENNEKALKRLATLAEKYQFQVWLANSPIHDDLYLNPDFQTYFQQVQDYLSQFCKNNGFHYINNPPMLFDEKEMENSDHLIEKAANKFTRALLEKM